MPLREDATFPARATASQPSRDRFGAGAARGTVPSLGCSTRRVRGFMSRALLISLVVLAIPVVSVCGGDDEGSADAGAAGTVPAEETATSAGGGTSADLDSKPEVEVPDGPPPDELEVEDLVEGDGDAARAGDLLEVEYVGVLYDTGDEFDSSWERDEPFAFQLGAGMVIPGWDEGLEGMEVGGRRRLTIPPDLAYGEAGAPPDIGPDQTLVFVIDLVDAR